MVGGRVGSVGSIEGTLTLLLEARGELLLPMPMELLIEAATVVGSRFEPPLFEFIVSSEKG